MASPFDHNLAAVSVIPAPIAVAIPVSLAYLYPSAAELDISALRDDHRFVDNDQGTGKCRHGEEWNNAEGKNSFHHDTLLSWDAHRPHPGRMRGWRCRVCIEMTSADSRTAAQRHLVLPCASSMIKAG
jgi:hypothetical protein